MARVLLYGGSFDPIHHGHVIVGRHVVERLDAARTILIPSAAPPHKQARRLAAAEHRLAMCRLTVADDPAFEVSDWELGQPGPNYTFATVRHFREQLGPATELFWLIGMDTLGELESWYRVSELADLCTFVTAARPGFAPPEAGRLERAFSAAQAARLLQHCFAGPRVEIAARDIRARVQAGRSIRYLVAEPVRAYIEAHGLYRGA